MLRKLELQKAIIKAAQTFESGGGSADHLDGMLRGLLWALTGTDQGCYLSQDMASVFTLAGIEHVVEDEKVHWTL